MTTITLSLMQNDEMAGYVISGHTGYGPAGEDLCCAAVSMLGLTCANALESVANVNPEIHQKDGYLSVSLSSQMLNAEAAVILKVFEQGARDLVNTYPKYIRLVTARR